MSANLASSPLDLRHACVKNSTSMLSSQRKWLIAARLSLGPTGWALKRHTFSLVEVVKVVSTVGSSDLLKGVLRLQVLSADVYVRNREQLYHRKWKYFVVFAGHLCKNACAEDSIGCSAV